MPPRRKAAPKSPAGPAGHEDPRAPLDGKALLAAAKPVLDRLAADLLERAKASPAVTAALVAQHHEEQSQRRTADPFPVWQSSFVDQVAAAWLLSCVFVRTLEDRGLLAHARLAGPGAADSQRLFFEMAPSLGERDYLLAVFREMCRFPAARALFDAEHNPVWMLAPSSEAAKVLLGLFRAPSAEAPAFRFGQDDTRFLGDLYQDLNEAVQKRYALLQTPRFVESFILDRTLERAVERFGREEATVIDPTCGSGHFLLGAFERLYDHRLRAEPGLGQREAARKALDAVYGTDINPYAVGIARFRLTLAFLEKAGFTKIAEAPVLPLHVVVADSLLHNAQLAQASFHQMEGQSAAAWGGRAFALEDEKAAREVLYRRYAAVVGNPPYITVKDKALRKLYAEMYSSCSMNYAMTVPFLERFFQLARDGGSVGMITANSFMKRQFGKKLVEQYLSTQNIDLIVNTSGAYIPGHGTPTVLLFGTAEAPLGNELLAVLAKRGEPTTPEPAENGLVWRSIAEHWRGVGFENEFISVSRVSRSTLAVHPWSLGGGGAAELKETLEDAAECRLKDIVEDIGFSVIVGEDDVFIRPRGAPQTRNLPTVPLVTGETVRDWSIEILEDILRPFDLTSLDIDADSPLKTALWQWRKPLEERIVSGSTTMREAKRSWYDVRRLSRDKHKAPRSIVFAFVASHNNFVLDNGGKVFNRSAPIIKLSETATEDDHLALLAYLNSSTACFWMKQVFFDKGNRGEGGGTTAEQWEKFFEFDGTKLRELPLPGWSPEQRQTAIDYARRLDQLGTLRQRLSNLQEIFDSRGDASALRGALGQRRADIRAVELEMRAMQEELDWYVYSTLDLCSSSLVRDVHSIEPGARAADVRFAREVERGAVGRRYFELCRVGAPHVIASSEWERRWQLTARLDIIEKSPGLALLESPTFKRTFREGFRELDVAAQARDWIRQKAEDAMEAMVAPQSCSQILAHLPVAQLHSVTHAALDLMMDGRTLNAIVAPESVPYLAALRYTDAGLEKRALWERTWELQRAEDRGEAPGEIPVPPKYDPKDYRDPTFWRLRGKLDVPKERFISYPGCESDEDGEPVYGWAGWTHLQQAQALAALYQKRKTEEAWEKDRLTPMLAGILELLPWIKQWHNAPSDEYVGMRLGDFFEGFLEGELRALSLTHDDLRTFRPEAKKRPRPAPKTKAARRSARDEEGEPT